jgi:hypothetical protein
LLVDTALGGNTENEEKIMRVGIRSRPLGSPPRGTWSSRVRRQSFREFPIPEQKCE